MLRHINSAVSARVQFPSRRGHTARNHSVRPDVGSRMEARCGIALEKWDAEVNGPLTERAMRDVLTKQGYHVVRYIFSPGTTFDWHNHEVSKKDSILSGRFLFKMAGEEIVLEAGDMLHVPAGELHYAEVVGNEAVVLFDASKY